MNTVISDSLVSNLHGALKGKDDLGQALATALDLVLDRFECVLGTIHGLDAQSGMLTLRVHRGLPEGLLERVRVIPIGKGMAGLAAQRLEPVQVCNLQCDTTGVAKPSARESQMAGSVAIPIMVGDRLRGTLGIAKPVEHQFVKAETELLLQAGAVIGEYLP
jgi:putative methionine-R-sulfoxide reductase with GAF domain